MGYRRDQLKEKLAELYDTLPKNERPASVPGVSTFYLWRKQWKASGYSEHRLINQYERRGRRPQMSAELASLLLRVVDEQYANENRPSVKEALDQAIAEVERHNREKPQKLPWPTRRQLVRKIKEFDRGVLLERRYGVAHARTATRIFGRAEQPTRLGERVEIDHTPLDVICIADSTGLIVGRPYLTSVIDVASKMIYGCCVSFREPNASSVLRALKQSILPKDQLLKELGIKAEWPASGVMSCLVCDNGKELVSNALEGAALDLGISLLYCPPRQPFFKGSIERYLKEINYQFMHLLPGTTFQKYHLRNDYDSMREAVIPFQDLRRLIYRWIVEVYIRKYHRGLLTCPLEKWKQLASLHGSPPLPQHVGVLDVFLAPIEFRSLGSKGIEINSLYYTGPELEDLRYRCGDQKLEVRPNRDDLGSIRVLHPETKTYVEATCTDPQYADGLSEEQHKWFRQHARERYDALPHHRAMLAAKLEMREEVNKMRQAHEARMSALQRSEKKACVESRVTQRDPKRRTGRSGVEAQVRHEVTQTVAPEIPQERPDPGYFSFGDLEPFEADQATLF